MDSRDLRRIAYERERWLRPDWQSWMPPRFKWPDERAVERKRAELRAREAEEEQEIDREGFTRLRWLVKDLQVDLMLRRLRLKYSPDQPRVPAGNPDGGRWTADGKWRVAGPPTGRPPTRFGGNFPTATTEQLTRLESAVARTQDALTRIRQYDPNWRPTTSSFMTRDGVDGAIRDSEARATEAEAYLNRVRSGIGGNLGPPLSETRPQGNATSFDGVPWINAYRAANNMPDLFGRPSWQDQGTVAVTQIGRSLIFGVNSDAPGYTAADREAANTWRWTLLNKYPDVMQTENIGQIPNNSLYHAEATTLVRAATEAGGDLSYRALEIHVDNSTCYSCREVLPLLGVELGNPTVTYVNTVTGARTTMRDGRWLP